MSVEFFFDAKEKQIQINIPNDLAAHDIKQIVQTLNDHDFDAENYFIDLSDLHNIDNTSLSLIYFLAGYAEKQNKTVQLVDCNQLIRNILDECNIYRNLHY